MTMSKLCYRCKLPGAFTRSPLKSDEQRNECRKCNSERVSAWQRANPEKTMLHQAKSRCNKSGVHFALKPSDIFIPDVCPVLGLKLTSSGDYAKDDGHSHGARATSASLDRIIPELGYVPGNVMVISHRANTLKQDATVEELTALINWLVAARVKALAEVSPEHLTPPAAIPRPAPSAKPVGRPALTYPWSAPVEPTPAPLAKSKPQIELFPGFTWTKKVA